MTSNPLPPRYRDRHIVPDDFKKLTLEVIEEPREPPLVGVFDLPVRCYVVNKEWDKHISGAVSVLTEWRAWHGDEDDRDSSVQAILAFLAQDEDCTVTQLQVRQNDTNPCLLEYSVNGGMDWIEFADILGCVSQEFLENSIITALNTNTTIQNIIDDQTDGGTDNELPPMPTSTEPDLLCDAAYYMTDKIIDFIDDTLTDAASITLEEFLTALLGLGGFEASLLKLFWDLIIANSYPDLLTDVQAARDAVSKILYCNELDKELVVSVIDETISIGDEAQAAFIGAINAITDGKWSLWAFVGSETDSGEDCSAFCPDEWESIIDFTESQHGFSFLIGSDSDPIGEWQDGVGMVAIVGEYSNKDCKWVFATLEFDEANVTYVNIEGTYTRGYDGGQTQFTATSGQVRNNGNNAMDARLNYDDYTIGVPTVVDTTETGDVTADEVLLSFRADYNGGTSGGGTVTTMTLRGTGTKPAQLP